MESRRQVRPLVEVHFLDPERRPELFDGVHQILMIGPSGFSMSHGTVTTTMLYEEIQEIKVSFIYE